MMTQEEARYFDGKAPISKYLEINGVRSNYTNENMRTPHTNHMSSKPEETFPK